MLMKLAYIFSYFLDPGSLNFD